MPPTTPAPPAPPPHTTQAYKRDPRWLAWANTPAAPLALIAFAVTLRLVWLAFFSPLNLTEDEAHYWLWSTQPDWSYTTKPPGIAWLIAASTALIGHSEFAVRLPAILAMGLTALAAADAARTLATPHPPNPDPDASTNRPHTAAFIAAAITLLAPALAVAGLLATIDAPLLAAWMAAVALTLRAIRSPERFTPWLAAAACIAIGLLFKHTAALLLPGLLWVAIRQHQSKRRLLALTLLALLGLVPNLIWNAQHHWPNAHHLLDHLQPGSTTPSAAAPTPIPLSQRLTWPALYLATLLIIVGPVPMILLITALFRRFAWPAGTRDLLRLALPIAVFYLLVALLTPTQANWAIAAPATLLPLAALCIMHGVRHNLWPIRFLWGATLVAGLATWTLIPILPRIHRSDPNSIVPTARVLGMPTHARAVAAELERLQAQTSLPPFILTNHYGRASQLIFEFRTQPEPLDILSASALIGGRSTQFDHWPRTNLNDPQTHRRLVGRPALILGGEPHHWHHAFETLEPLGPLAGEPKRNRTAYLATGYRGFPPPDLITPESPTATLLPATTPVLDPASDPLAPAIP